MAFQNPYRVWKDEWDKMSPAQKAGAATFALIATTINPLIPVVYLGVYGVYGSQLNKQADAELDCCDGFGCPGCDGEDDDDDGDVVVAR
jgi:nitrate reductase NapE component